MPWSHCGAEVNDVDRRCPVCGETKADWTVRLKKTRVLRLGGDQDEEAQVLALQAAARRGAAFCEMCARERER